MGYKAVKVRFPASVCYVIIRWSVIILQLCATLIAGRLGCGGFCCRLKSQFRIIVFLNMICLLSQRRFLPLIVSSGNEGVFMCEGRKKIVLFSLWPTLIWPQAQRREYQEKQCCHHGNPSRFQTQQHDIDISIYDKSLEGKGVPGGTYDVQVK